MKRPPVIFLTAILVLEVTVFGGILASYAGTGPQQSEPVPPPKMEDPETPTEYEREYQEWQACEKESAPLKQGTMLIEFLQKHPKSMILPNVNAAYKHLLFTCSESEKYQELETLSEQWLKYHSNDPQRPPDYLQAIAYSAKAAAKLKHYKLLVQRQIEYCNLQPSGALAKEIADTYREMDEKDKYLEWMQKAAKYSEFKSNFLLRYELVDYYLSVKDLPKAAEWARETLNAAGLVKEPGTETRDKIQAARHTCCDVIGKDLYKQGKFDEAIRSFKQALREKDYGDGYYQIALCFHKKKAVDDAMLWYAKTELWCKEDGRKCGDIEANAKTNLENIYKSLHDNTVIGIEKIYKKVREKPDSYWTSDPEPDRASFNPTQKNQLRQQCGQ